LILRGVSDLVGSDGNPAYDESEKDFQKEVKKIIPKLINIVNEFL
jgi:hypothetical protein